MILRPLDKGGYGRGPTGRVSVAPRRACTRYSIKVLVCASRVGVARALAYLWLRVAR